MDSENSRQTVESLHIIDGDGKTIFSGSNYIIPLYQRAFAWSDKEISQLIDDVYGFAAENYYIGSLVVKSRKEGYEGYEVIDGQQRLTALYLLLNYLGYRWQKNSLCYECREKSNYTLNRLNETSPGSDCMSELAEEDKIEQTLLKGRSIIDQKLAGKKDVQKLKEKLARVVLFRIEVPEHTDLNRYFETMNSSGEQLEQHDIVKANLMKLLQDDAEESQGEDERLRKIFACVWDACRDMNGYVQMHFEKKQRESMFGTRWNDLPANIFAPVGGAGEEKGASAESDRGRQDLSILGIIEGKIDDDKPPKGEDEEGYGRPRFESITNFPYFLLYVLDVFVSTEFKEYSGSVSYDDHKLQQIFDSAVREWKEKRGGNGKEFSLAFIECLLKCRFLFDKYIIKREYKNEDSDWSLKTLCKSRGEKYTYWDTDFGKGVDCSQICMLQACLRVSYTSPRSSWIPDLLKWLIADDKLEQLSQYEDRIESIAKERVREFLQEGNYRQGVNTPHIVLNYLDYLLWKERKKEEYKKLGFEKFTFEFRNSVEHWYPQHPSRQSFEPWDDFDRFGNLCILQRDVNAKFSNLSPVSKNNSYRQMIEKGSLKLRLMSSLTKDDRLWKEETCADHEREMLNLLKEACGVR